MWETATDTPLPGAAAPWEKRQGVAEGAGAPPLAQEAPPEEEVDP